MLLSLRIENFALIDRLELSFDHGLNVLTGETGAGKSIILDAIDAILGGKITSRAIRTGCNRAIVEGSFRLSDSLRQWLMHQEIDLLEEDELICSRELSLKDGRLSSRSRLNGVLVNKQQMEILRESLVEITAQGQTTLLGKMATQRDWLDHFGGDELLQQRQAVATAYGAWRQASQLLEQYRQSERQRWQKLDLYHHQLAELRSAHLSDPTELATLEQERQRLSHAVELQQQSYQVLQILYENDQVNACSDLLGQAEDVLLDMERYDPQIKPILELVQEALAQVQEAGRQISSYGDGIEADPQRLRKVEERIIQLKQICRKYGPTLAEAIALKEQIASELAELTGNGQSIEELERLCQEKHQHLQHCCQQLSQSRRVAAQRLEAHLIAELKPLAMQRVQFQVEIRPTTPSTAGADQITFMFSPNPGEPLQPLIEIASGGEMSRFLLALKACFSQIDPVGTLVFDEIDVGVSGRVAEAIADKLYQLGRDHQVLCVTHQPIVAATANNHFRVIKQVTGEDNPTPIHSLHRPNDITLGDEVRTVVRVSRLDDRQRRDELAQLAGGQSSSHALNAATYAFVDSLLEKAALRQGKPPLVEAVSKITLRPSLRSSPKASETA